MRIKISNIIIMDIPISFYRYLLRISVVVTVLGSLWYYNLDTTPRLLKITVAWFLVIMTMNLINMDVTLGHYKKNKIKRGIKGISGSRGPKGFKGSGETCGSICGPNVKPMEADNLDDNGNINTNENILIGPCKFPFVYKYTNQYAPLKPCTEVTDNLTCYDIDKNDNPIDPKIPPNGKGGVCATLLDNKNNPIRWGYTKDSDKLIALRTQNEYLNEKDKEYQKTNTGILDIELVKGRRSDTQCPSGYKKLDTDLNEASNGSYVYACTREGISSKGVSHVNIAVENEDCQSVFSSNLSADQFSKVTNTKKLPVNLNADVTELNPVNMYMCLAYGNKNYLTDIKFKNDRNFTSENSDFTLIDKNLNEGTNGNEIYMYVSRTKFDFKALDTAFYYDKKIYFFTNNYFVTYDKNFQVSTQEEILNKFGRLPNLINGAFVNPDDNDLYFLSGSEVYKYNRKKMNIEEDYPKKISDVFNGIPDNIDSVLTFTDKNLYFFKDKFIYKYSRRSNKVETGYPRLIKTRFPGAPNNPDAVFLNENDKTVYFIRGNQYWELDINEDIKSGFPRYLKDKFGATTTNPTESFFSACNTEDPNKILFFGGIQGNSYYEFNKISYEINDEKPIQHLFKNAPPTFDTIYFNDFTQTYYIFKDSNLYYYKFVGDKKSNMRGIRFIYKGFTGSVQNAFQIKNTKTVYLLQASKMIKYQLNDNFIDFKQITSVEKPKFFPDNLDSIFFHNLDKEGNHIYILLKGIQFMRIKYNPVSEKFSKIDNTLVYLDQKGSPFFKKDENTEKGLKVRSFRSEDLKN